MKIFPALNDTTENRISFVFLSLFLFLFPFGRFYGQMIFAGFFLHTLIHLKRNNLRRLKNTGLLLLISLYLLAITGTAYSPDKAEAFGTLEKQAALLLMPFSLAVTNLNLARYRMFFLKVFSAGCITASLYLYFDALRAIVYNDLPLRTLFSTFFLNQNFSSAIGMHATYLSIYNALSIVFLLLLAMEEKRKHWLAIYIAGIVLLYAALVQLGSKAVILSLLLIMNTIFPFMALKGKNRKIFLLFSLLNTLLLILVIININSYSKRYIAGFRNEFVPASVSNVLPEPRADRWRLAFELGKESLLYGHGTGSEKELLKEKYFRNKLYHSYLHELNAHNQYLSLLITYGIPAVVIFLLLLAKSYMHALRRKDVIFAAFLVICTVISFSENILGVNKGIFFFGFFLSFFLLPGVSGENRLQEKGTVKGNL